MCVYTIMCVCKGLRVCVWDCVCVGTFDLFAVYQRLLLYFVVVGILQLWLQC